MEKVPAVLAPAACIAGLAFEALVRVRNRLYASSVLTQHRLPAPVISVGNLTLGGTGKTPTVIYLAQMLIKMGFTPAILTRGYGRTTPDKPYILPPGPSVADAALTLGDEPALIRRHVSGAWLGISKKRLTTGHEIAKQVERPVFLLDDGFQHRCLYRDLDIVIVDRTQPLKTNRMFPRGTLREPITELCRGQVVLLNGVIDKVETDPVAEEIQSLHPRSRLFYSAQSIDALIPFASWRDGLMDCNQRARVQSAYLVAAVGNPERLYRDVRQMGIEVRGTGFFPDHYRLKPRDWRACKKGAHSQSADVIIITEKDAIKLEQPPDFPVYVAVQSTEILDAWKLERALRDTIEERV